MVWKHDLRELKLGMEEKSSLNDSYERGGGDREGLEEEESCLMFTNCQGNSGGEERSRRLTEDHVFLRQAQMSFFFLFKH